MIYSILRIVKRLFWISRPISWPNTAYPFAAGYLLSSGGFDATLIIGTIFFLIPYNLLMYGVNDVFDYESDIRNPRKGGIEGMREERSFHPIILRASILVTIPFVAYFLLAGSSASNAVFIAVIAGVLAYSVPYLRFKEAPILDSITSSLHFVGPLIFALVLQNNVKAALPYVVAFFFWGMASHAFGAVQDILPDRKGGLASVATALGGRNTVWIAFGLYIAASGILMAQATATALIGLVGLAYAVNIIPYLQVTDANSVITNAGWKRFLWLNYVVGFVITMVLLSRTVLT